MLEPFASVKFWISIPAALLLGWLGIRAARLAGQWQRQPPMSARAERGLIGMLVTGMATDAYFRGLGDGGGVLMRLMSGINLIQSSAYYVFALPMFAALGLTLYTRWLAPPLGRELLSVAPPRRLGTLVVMIFLFAIIVVDGVAGTAQRIAVGLGGLGLLGIYLATLGKPVSFTEVGIHRPLAGLVPWNAIKDIRFEQSGPRHYVRIDHSADRRNVLIPDWARSECSFEVPADDRPVVEAFLLEQWMNRRA